MKQMMQMLLKAMTFSMLLLISCKTVQQTSNTSTSYERIKDSIVVYDTVYVPLHIIDEQHDDAAINMLQSKNDSLLNTLTSTEAKLTYLAKQLQNGKLNIDTIRTKTRFANAWATVTNNELRLGLNQVPFDTIANFVNTSTFVHDLQVTTTEQNSAKIAKVSVFADAWFWTTIILLAFIGLILFLRR